MTYGLDPFYFGSGTRRLFGVYHAPGAHAPGAHAPGAYAPGAETARDCGVVLCHPLGQEYIRSHRAYRQLAIALAQAGFPVLRFDFHGCGDSGGSRHEGAFDPWLADIAEAIAALQGRCDAAAVCLAGVRLGASLAALFGAERGPLAGVESVVLWDPVVAGPPYLEELLAPDPEMQRFARPEPAPDGFSEAAGFPLPPALRLDLERLNLLASLRRPAEHVLLLESEEEACEPCLQERWKSLGARLTHRRVSDSRPWTRNPSQAIVPGAVVRSVVAWVSEVHS